MVMPLPADNDSELLQQAVQQIKTGQKQAAAQYLARVLREDPDRAEAWLWLSACVETPEKQIYCLRQVLRIDPHHPAALKGLEELTRVGEEATPFEARREAPAKTARRPGRLFWLALGLALMAVVGLNWAQQYRTGSSGGPFIFPPGRYASADVRIRPGDDLAAMIRGAPDGGEVYLQAGVYTLDATIEITRGIQLRGAGLSETRIHSSAPGAALRLLSGDSLQIADMEILHTGETAANVLEVVNGRFTASGIRVGGANTDPNTGEGGRGLLVTQNASAAVTASEFLDNEQAGVEIRASGAVTLERNAVHDNGMYGMVVAGSASPRLQENAITGNGKVGIWLLESAKGELRGNMLENNGVSGILLEDRAAPLVFSNTSQENIQYGVEIHGEAAPVLISNTARRNGKAGMAYFDRASGAAESNDCSENELHGISVNGDADPFLKENRCNQNRQVGIDYWGNSGGTAANNQCSENGLQGIAVHENAQPALQNNACQKNSDTGIIYWDNAAGTASNNDCSGNRINGISVHDQARPVLVKNTCRNNMGNGIIFYDQTGGEARENECRENGTDAIQMPEGGSILLKGNRCGTP